MRHRYDSRANSLYAKSIAILTYLPNKWHDPYCASAACAAAKERNEIERDPNLTTIPIAEGDKVHIDTSEGNQGNGL